MQRTGGQLHAAVWGWPQARPLAAALARIVRQRQEQEQDLALPEGFDYRQVLWALRGGWQSARYRLVQRRPVLELESDEGDPQGSPLGVLTMDVPEIQWWHQDPQGQAGVPHVRDVRTPTAIPTPNEGRLVLQGNRETLIVDGISRPSRGQRHRAR